MFTERIEGWLRSSEIDIAVHSLKDLPVEDPDELCVGAVLGREEAREVLVSKEGRSLSALPPGAVIGSSSTRRQAQLLSLRPDLLVRPIRGNVETRIRKVESGDYDATILAGAGVLRLGLSGKIAQWLTLPDILPAPGQGAIAVQCRSADLETRDALAAIDEPALRAETDAERGFLRALGGGCSAPVGAFAQVQGSRLRLHGRVCALDGSRTVDVEAEGEDRAALVAELSRRALREGAAELIAQARAAMQESPSGSPRRPRSATIRRRAGVRRAPLQGLRVLVTRARAQADELCGMLAAAGAVPVTVPLIRIAPLEDTAELDAAIERLSSYRWLVFASSNGVECFMKRYETKRPPTLAAEAEGRGGRPTFPFLPPWDQARHRLSAAMGSASTSCLPSTPGWPWPRASCRTRPTGLPAGACSCRGRCTAAKRRRRSCAGTGLSWRRCPCIGPNRFPFPQPTSPLLAMLSMPSSSRAARRSPPGASRPARAAASQGPRAARSSRASDPRPRRRARTRTEG